MLRTSGGVQLLTNNLSPRLIRKAATRPTRAQAAILARWRHSWVRDSGLRPVSRIISASSSSTSDASCAGEDDEARCSRRVCASTAARDHRLARRSTTHTRTTRLRVISAAFLSSRWPYRGCRLPGRRYQQARQKARNHVFTRAKSSAMVREGCGGSSWMYGKGVGGCISPK